MNRETVLSKFLKKKRLQAGLTQQELAIKLEYGLTHIYYWEKGKTVPPVNAMKRLSEVFGTPLEELFNLHLKVIFQREKIRLEKKYERG